MANLTGKIAGQTVLETTGPLDGINYNIKREASPAAPTIDVRVAGTGTVDVLVTTTGKLVGNSGLNAYTYQMEADETTFVPLLTNVGIAGATATLPVGTDFCAIRVVVNTEGTGTALVRSIYY